MVSIAADYGMTLLRGASSDAAIVAAFIMPPTGQRLFEDEGFEAVALPSRESSR